MHASHANATATLASITGRARHPILPSYKQKRSNLVPVVTISRAWTQKALDGLGEAETAKEPVVAVASDLHVGTRVALGRS